MSLLHLHALKIVLQFFLNEPDALSPWTIGRYGDENGADNFAEEKIKGDMEAIKKQNEENERRYGEGAKRLDYMPVVFPGGSVRLNLAVEGLI
jgi:hypothetical protein